MGLDRPQFYHETASKLELAQRYLVLNKKCIFCGRFMAYPYVFKRNTL